MIDRDFRRGADKHIFQTSDAGRRILHPGILHGDEECAPIPTHVIQRVEITRYSWHRLLSMSSEEEEVWRSTVASSVKS